MVKIENDKYYTPIDIANHCCDVVYNAIGDKWFNGNPFNPPIIIEPSCGDGSFFHSDKFRPTIAFDIDLSDEKCFWLKTLSWCCITEGDYLKYDYPITQRNMDWGSKYLVIGNPPYGSRMNLAQKFFHHSTQFADYIAFILPISQLNNTQSLYEFDLIYSEDLGIQDYSGRKLHCCFNIYKRPEKGLNSRPKTKLKCIKMVRNDSKSYKDFKDYDIRMCGWGDGTAGKLLTAEDKEYACEYKIKVTDIPERDEVIKFFKEYDWNGCVNGIAMKRLKQFHILNILHKEFPDLD